jgi:hypothetical protein
LVKTVFIITQHINNKLLIEANFKCFDVGCLSVVDSRKNIINFIVTDKDFLFF